MSSTAVCSCWKATMAHFVFILGFLWSSFHFYLASNNEKAPVVFTFPEYQYKDTAKNEMTFREFETACAQSSACSGAAGLARGRCVRECVCPSCYREIYQIDQLEEGEIDVRLNSFKGCFIQRSGRTRN